MTETDEKLVNKGEEAADGNADAEVNQKLMAQIEYYFGDVNLPRDRFIKEECSKNDGWFPVATLLKFNRVVNILKNVPSDDRVKRICIALTPSELVDVNDEKLQIRRSPDCPLPEKDAEDRTIYLKGFHRTETTLDGLLEHFKKEYEGVESVIMRYYKEKTIKTEAEIRKEQEEKQGISIETGNGKADDQNDKADPQLVWVRKFKGSIFVVFKTIEQATQLLNETNTVINGTTITIKMWQSAYKAQKTKEYQEKLANRKRKQGNDEKKGECNDEEGKDEESKEDYPKGALVKVLNVPDGFTREIIKEKWFSILDKDKFAIIYIDFNMGDKNAVLRLEKEGSASEALEKIPEKRLKMKEAAEGQEEIYSELEGFGEEEEVSYIEGIKRQRETAKSKKRGAGGRGRPRFGKRKRRY